mmetsp:Transcript_33006/g.74498  ORF Transcript_33006/g.74498 Transcript_33006/m.74498 type:complete len:334 (+) Transcript_33006:191-1192(+)
MSLPELKGASRSEVSAKPMFLTSKMKEENAERTGGRKSIFGVRTNEKFYEEKRSIGGKPTVLFPFKGGEQYVGEWMRGEKSGFGTQNWAQGHKYEGEWQNGKRMGKGTFFVKDKGANQLRKQYTGDWVDDKKHGVGVFIGKTGDVYEGEWQLNLRHGMGKQAYAPGSAETSYNGSWAAGKRSGLGILELANGDRYEGHWLNDFKEGPGRYFYRATNKVYVGEWVAGIPKCGSYSDAPLGCFPDLAAAVPETVPSTFDGANGALAEPFVIPDLHVLGAGNIVSEAAAQIRADRARRQNAEAAAEAGDAGEEGGAASPAGSVAGGGGGRGAGGGG